MYVLRPAVPEDRERLRSIHHAAFHDAVARVWGWDDVVQDRMWDDYFSNANLQVIDQLDISIGYLDVERTADSMFIANIALDPTHQGKGIGTMILKSLLREAEVSGVPVTLEVLTTNHLARGPYMRLGFRVTGETETHFQMAR